MKRSVINKFEAMENTLSGYVAQATYRYMNLCVKAEAVSLLSARFNIQGEEKTIEQVAQVAKKGDYQFMAVPKFDEDMTPLAVGIALKHPEFKQEYGQKSVDVYDDQGNRQTVKVNYLLLTMPEVDDSRYKVLKAAVDEAYNECKAKMEAVLEVSKPEFELLMKGEDKQDIDRMKKAFEKSKKTWGDHRDKLYKEKKQEIEDAHDKWVAQQAEERLNRIQIKSN
jgi:hypothetical protein